MKPDFFKDEDLAEYPFWVRILYEGLWCQADKEGRLEDRPIRLRAEIFPYPGKYERAVDMEAGLNFLSQPKKHSPDHRPFIVRYEVNGERYIQIVKWRKHETPHHTEKDSLIPAPPDDYSRSTPGAPLERSGCAGSEQEQGTMNLSRISFQNLQWEGIGEGDVESWAKAFPACDVPGELAKMGEWLKANPTKKKSNYRRFIVSWLTRTQDKGGTNRGPSKADPLAGIKKWGQNRGVL